MKSFLTAGLALAACAALADAKNGIVYQDNFNGDSADRPWSSGGTVKDGKMAIAEEATCTPKPVADLTCRVAEFDVDISDAGEAPSIVPTNAQLAVAAGPEVDGKVSIYVFSGSGAVWKPTGVSVTPGTVRIRMVFNYATKRCDLTVGGVPAGTYAIIGGSSATFSAVNSLTFIGATTVDDIKLADLDKKFTSGAAAGLTVTYDNLVAWGVDPTAVTEEAAGKLTAGLAPNGTATFTAKAMSANSITVPCDADNGQVYQVVITDGAGNAVDTVAATAGEIADGKRTLTFEMPTTDKKVLKFQVKASAPATTSVE